MSILTEVLKANDDYGHVGTKGELASPRPAASLSRFAIPPVENETGSIAYAAVPSMSVTRLSTSRNGLDIRDELYIFYQPSRV